MRTMSPKVFLPLLLLLVVPAKSDDGILDCLTGPCVTVAGVGKLQGTWQSTQWTDRRVYGFMGIPFGETTGGEHRFLFNSPFWSNSALTSYFNNTYILAMIKIEFPKVWSPTAQGASERRQ